MKCPKCGSTSKIKYCAVLKNKSIHRYRVCDKCGIKFSSYESYKFIPEYMPEKDDSDYTTHQKVKYAFKNLNKANKLIFWEFLRIMDLKQSE